MSIRHPELNNIMRPRSVEDEYTYGDLIAKGWRVVNIRAVLMPPARLNSDLPVPMQEMAPRRPT